MLQVQINENLYELDGKVRVERGFARKSGVADDATMAQLVGKYAVGSFDSYGKVIVKDQPFDYVDWAGGLVTWYVYDTAVDETIDATRRDANGALIWDHVDANGKALRWMPKGSFASMDDALSFARSLAA